MNGHKVRIRTWNGVTEVYNDPMEYDVSLDKENKEVEINIDSGCCCSGVVVLNASDLNELISSLQEMKKEIEENS
jgi:hypothetical protein